MSCITLSPFREIAVHFLQVREHGFPLTLNLLPEQPRFQAFWSRSYELAPKPLTTSNRRAIALTMAARIRKISATATAPLTTEPMQRVAGRIASRASEAPSDPALPPARARHRPFLQRDLDLDAGRRDHEAAGESPCERGAGHHLRPFQRDRSPSRDGSCGQARVFADQASVWALWFSDPGHHVKISCGNRTRNISLTGACNAR